MTRSKCKHDWANVLGNVNYGQALILITRSDYFQAGLIIKKGSYDLFKALEELVRVFSRPRSILITASNVLQRA